MIYTADFETTKNDDGSMRVWLADVCSVDDLLVHDTFYNIDDFLEFAFNQKRTATLYFHNFKFDGSYIIYWLHIHGYKWSEKPKNKLEYNILVTDKSQWFMGTAINEHGKRINLRDSLKKIPMSVRQMAAVYKLPILKGEIDYKKPRPIGYIADENEIAYIRNDTEIVARTLLMHFQQGMTELTAPADALAQFKNTVDYESMFVPKWWSSHRAAEKFCRMAYNGGISWVNPRIQGEVLRHCLVYDYNSMYPSVMLKYPFPVGYPIEFTGKPPKTHPLYIAKCIVNIQRKPDHIASIRNPINNTWIDDEYSGELILTSADVEILQMNYYGSCDIIWGYAWRGVEGVFAKYIEYWSHIKRTTTGAMRALAKLMLNSLYGKFGTNPDRQHKIPVWDENNNLSWRLSDVEEGKCFNVAVAAFVTAYARLELSIGASQCSNLAYVDTDSLHIFSTPTKAAKFTGRIHETEFGAWKCETRNIVRAKYLRQKTYIEELSTGKLNIAACGCPAESRKYITFDNFDIGVSYKGKLRPTMRHGGVELVETRFTVRAPIRYTM